MRYRDISIRKKILLSNFLMVLIPIIFVCFILFSMLLGFSFVTHSPAALIRNVLLNTSNYGPTLLIKTMNDELAGSDSISDEAERILAQLEKAGLHIFVEEKENDEILYHSAGINRDTMQQEFESIAAVKQYELPYIIWNKKGMAYQAELKNTADKTLRITFSGKDLSFPEDSYESWEHTKLMIKITIVATGVFMVLFIVALGAVLTRKLAQHILIPLYDLNQATSEIRNGNLKQHISVEKEDEIGELCSNFEAMRKQLIESEKLRTQYDLNRKELIAGISHDLSTPLTSMQGYVNGLLDGIADTPEKQQHYLHIIQEKTNAMNALVESLFLLSKLDLGQVPFHDECVNLQDFLQDWYQECASCYDHAIVNYRNEASQPVMILMDRTHFIRVLDNLCQNSIKYRREDPVHIDVTLQCDKHNCVLIFQDDGVGIDPSQAPRLFDSFYRSDPARSSKVKGSGLGLSITKQIITQMKGNISASGELNKGLCITIRLPLLQGGTTL